jgi:E3 ubiquitin-protein ligase BOI-like protein
MNPFSLQSHSPHLIDLTQLHNQQQQRHQQHQNIVSTGLGLSFGDQQQQQRLQFQHHQQQQQQNGFHSSQFLSLLSHGLGSQIKQQKDEIDQFLQAQVEIYFLYSLINIPVIKNLFFYKKNNNLFIREKSYNGH